MALALEAESKLSRSPEIAVFLQSYFSLLPETKTTQQPPS